MRAHDYSYSAEGRRIELRVDPEWVLVDPERAGPRWRGRLTPAHLRGKGISVAEGRWVVPTRFFSDPVRRKLEQEGALSPVFRYGGQLVLVLPVVRAELCDGADADAVAARHPGCRRRTWREQGLELIPHSGSVDDTLSTARALAADPDVVAATPRLVRVDQRSLRRVTK